MFSFHLFRTILLVLALHENNFRTSLTKSICEVNMCKGQYQKDLKKRWGLMEVYIWVNEWSTYQQWQPYLHHHRLFVCRFSFLCTFEPIYWVPSEYAGFDLAFLFTRIFVSLLDIAERLIFYVMTQEWVF